MSLKELPEEEEVEEVEEEVKEEEDSSSTGRSDFVQGCLRDFLAGGSLGWGPLPYPPSPSCLEPLHSVLGKDPPLCLGKPHCFN